MLLPSVLVDPSHPLGLAPDIPLAETVLLELFYLAGITNSDEPPPSPPLEKDATTHSVHLRTCY